MSAISMSQLVPRSKCHLRFCEKLESSICYTCGRPICEDHLIPSGDFFGCTIGCADTGKELARLRAQLTAALARCKALEERENMWDRQTRYWIRAMRGASREGLLRLSEDVAAILLPDLKREDER